jgi:hypothetical protein
MSLHCSNERDLDLESLIEANARKWDWKCASFEHLCLVFIQSKEGSPRWEGWKDAKGENIWQWSVYNSISIPYMQYEVSLYLMEVTSSSLFCQWIHYYYH